MMKRFTRRGADAAALTVVWAGPWAGAAAGAAGEGTANVNAAARGREVSPHAQTAAHTTCPHVLQRSHLSNPAKMKVRLTKSGITKRKATFFEVIHEHITCHFIPTITRQPAFKERLRDPNQHWSKARVNKTCQPQQNPSFLK